MISSPVCFEPFSYYCQGFTDPFSLSYNPIATPKFGYLVGLHGRVTKLYCDYYYYYYYGQLLLYASLCERDTH